MATKAKKPKTYPFEVPNRAEAQNIINNAAAHAITGLCWMLGGHMNLVRAFVIRSDGYSFIVYKANNGERRIKAGCRDFNLKEAKRHWGKRHYRYSLRRDRGARHNMRIWRETQAILAYFQASGAI